MDRCFARHLWAKGPLGVAGPMDLLCLGSRMLVRVLQEEPARTEMDRFDLT